MGFLDQRNDCLHLETIREPLSYVINSDSKQILNAEYFRMSDYYKNNHLAVTELSL
jgi:hypothetical protein